MHVATLAADWNGTLTERPTPRSRISSDLSSLGARLDKLRTAWWQTLVQVTFGLFMGGLVALLVLLYSDILII
jgi:ABC-type phosphate/phosphonate transport system permease subunit